MEDRPTSQAAGWRVDMSTANSGIVSLLVLGAGIYSIAATAQTANNGFDSQNVGFTAAELRVLTDWHEFSSSYTDRQKLCKELVVVPKPIIEESCKGDEDCFRGIHYHLQATADTIYLSDPFGAQSITSIVPQNNLASVTLGSEPDFELNSPLIALRQDSRPRWLFGANLTLRFDPLIVKKFVRDEAYSMLNAEIDRQRKALTPEVEREALDRVQTAVDSVVEQRLAELPDTIDSSPRFQSALAEQRTEFERQIEREVAAELDNNPALLGLSPQEAAAQRAELEEELLADAMKRLDGEVAKFAETIRSELIAQATNEIERERDLAISKESKAAIREAKRILAQELAEARRDFARRIERASDELAFESVIDQAAFSVARVHEGDQSGMTYLRFGKVIIENGADKDASGRTPGEVLSGFHSFAERAGSVSNTLGVNVGTILPLDSTTFATVDLYAFHNRNPAISSRDYIGNRLALLSSDPKEFEAQTNYGDINSVLVRGSVSGSPESGVAAEVVDDYSIFGSVANYNGEWGGTVGGTVSLPGCLGLQGSVTTGNPTHSGRAFSLQAHCDFGGITGFAQYDNARDIYDHGVVKPKREQYSVGANIVFYENCESNSLFCSRVRAKFAVGRLEETGPGRDMSSKFTVGGGFEFGLHY